MRLGRGRVALWGSIGAALMGLAGLLSTLLVSSPDMSTLHGPPLLESRAILKDPELKQVQDDIKQLRVRLDALSQVPEPSVFTGQLKAMEDTLKQVRGQVTELEEAILGNPARVIAVPLLSKELEDVKARNDAATLTVNQNIDRQYNLMQWVFGSFGLGLLGLGISVFRTTKVGGTNGSA